MPWDASSGLLTASLTAGANEPYDTQAHGEQCCRTQPPLIEQAHARLSTGHARLQICDSQDRDLSALPHEFNRRRLPEAQALLWLDRTLQCRCAAAQGWITMNILCGYSMKSLVRQKAQK